VKIITNQRRPRHTDVIRDLLKNATKVWIFVAYLGRSGMDEVEQALKAACARKLDLEIYCGLSQCVSNPDALWRLFKMFGKTKTAKLYLWDQPRQTFHPKVYCFFHGSHLTLVIGSANLTSGGMEKNLELSSIQTLPLNSDAARAIETFRSDIAERVNPADELGLRQYRRRYDIYRTKREKAEKEARKEIKQVRELKLNEIKSYLARYYKNGKDQRFQRRQVRYLKAKSVLKKLADTPHLDKSAFLKLYSELVGGGGEHRLWTSSGLARSKSEVASHYTKVVSLVRQIRKSSAKSPEAVFRIGQNSIRTIQGFGVNLLTEAMHTFGPDRFAVLNKPPLVALKAFGCDPFPSSNSFSAEMYAEFNDIVGEVKKECGFKSMAQADDFLSYVYGRVKRKLQRTHPATGSN
jgi:HKD family nuclease